jgi:hypothetical protein
MSKIKIKMKLTGFELEIEGTHENVPNISHALGKQLASLMQAPDAVLGKADGTRTLPGAPIQPVEEVHAQTPVRKTTRKRRTTNNVSTGGDDGAEVAIDFRHEAAKYGTPSQNWTTLQKAMWLLYVVGEESGVKEMSGRRVVLTFNKHYRQAKEVMVANVNRDLGRAKVKSPSLVGEDNTKSPPAWYLTEEGVKSVQAQIAAALGRK